MDKHTLKANALAAMRACIASEWSSFCLNTNINKLPPDSIPRKLYTNAVQLTDLQVEEEMKKCFDNLTEYYKNGTR
jgi:hypothetical protein